MTGKAKTMRPVQRAAIGGLFAIWLAPLAAGARECPDCRPETREEAPARREAGSEPARKGQPQPASTKAATHD